jgi:hypothetical protein
LINTPVGKEKLQKGEALERAESKTLFDVEAGNHPVLRRFIRPEIAADYKAFARSYFDFTTLIAASVVGVAFGVTRNNIQFAFSSGPFFLLATIVNLITFLIFLVFIFAKATKLLSSYIGSGYASYFSTLLRDSFYGHYEDTVGVLATLSAGFQFYARVIAGPCDFDYYSETSSELWEGQACNPGARCGLIPFDEALFLYLLPVTVQITFRGMTFQSVVFSWLISNVFVATAVIHKELWENAWILILSLLLLLIIFECERFMRRSFTQRTQLLEAETLTVSDDHEL